MIFRELGRFWYFDVSKVSGAWNFAFRRFSNMGICCTIQGHNTQIHPQTQRNRTHVHIMFKTTLRYALKNSSDTLFTSPDNIRHQQTPANAIPCQHDPWTAFLGVWGSLLVSFGVCWSLMVSVVVLISSEIPGGGVWEHIDEEYVCLWLGCI